MHIIPFRPLSVSVLHLELLLSPVVMGINSLMKADHLVWDRVVRGKISVNVEV